MRCTGKLDPGMDQLLCNDYITMRVQNFNFGCNQALDALKIFGTLDKLWLSFNQLFGGKSCVEIRIHTRDLVKKVFEGTYEIFQELLTQVEGAAERNQSTIRR